MSTDSGAMPTSSDVKDIKESTDTGKPTSNATVSNELGLGKVIRNGLLRVLKSYKKELEEQKISGELVEIIDTFLNEQASDEIIKKKTQDLKNIYTNLQGTSRQIATHLIAVFYVTGSGGITESKETHGLGIKLLDYLAKEECAPAITSLGHCFNYGQGGIKKDSEKACELYHRAAYMNYTEAMLVLGEIFTNGIGCERDYSGAVAWYKRAAELGDSVAMTRLAERMFYGIGCALDQAKAIEWLKRSKDILSITVYGNLFQYGAGDRVKIDLSKAVDLYQAAAELGDVSAMISVGLCFLNGQGVEKDLAKAGEWFQRAKHAGYMHSLGKQYQSELQDNKRAFELFDSAAKLGDVIAMSDLGLCFLNGQGVEKDLTKAGEWLKRANAISRVYALGRDWEYGLNGAVKNPLKAFEHYQLAANLGYVAAMERVGNCFLNGIGVKQDNNAAFEWSLRAVEFGDKSAMFTLTQCLQNELGTQQDFAKILDWSQRAAKVGNGAAIVNLATFFLNGQGIARDPKTAYEYCQLASDLNLTNARYILGCILRQIWSELNSSSYQQQTTEIRRDRLLSKIVVKDTTIKKDIDDLLSQLDSKNRDEQCHANSTLGFCYVQGLGVEQDIRKALTCFLRGWELGARYCLLDIWYVLQHHTKIASEQISFEQIKGYCEEWIKEEKDALKKAHACILMAEILQSAHCNQTFSSAKYFHMALQGVNNHLPLTQTVVTRGEKIVRIFDLTQAVSQATPLPSVLGRIIGEYDQEMVVPIPNTPMLISFQNGTYIFQQNALDQKQRSEELETLNNQVLILSGKLNKVVQAVSAQDEQENTDVKDNKEASKNVGSSKQG